jgi:putative transposase
MPAIAHDKAHKLSFSIRPFHFSKEETMPVPKKKRTTSENGLSTSQPSSPMLPEQQEFHQHPRALAQSAVRTVLKLVMREELDAFIGAAWGECSSKRKGYRNGTYTRDLVTSTDQLQDIKVRRRP